MTGVFGLLLAGALVQGLPRARPADVGLSAAALDRIAPALRAKVDSGKFPGFVAAVARHGKLVYFASIGTSATGAAHAPASDAVFRIFSMTKPITSVAVMQLYETGKLRLDDPVSQYVPAFANAKVFAGGASTQPQLKDPDRPVTIGDLLTHTAGLTYGLFGNTPVDSIYLHAGLFDFSLTAAQLSDSLAHLPLMFSPGTKWNYSFGIDVLGRIVEVVSGQTLDRFLDSSLFQPLGMRMTAFHVTPAMQPHVIAVYERGAGGKLQAQTPFLQPGFTDAGKLLSGGGGLLSTPGDYLRFAQMLLNGGELDGRRVLRPETVQLMLQNHLAAGVYPITPGPNWPRGHTGFGYGGAVALDVDSAAGGSAGMFRWAGYATTFFWIDPKTDLVAMLWTQFAPVMEDGFALDNAYQRLVYKAVIKN